MGAGWTVWSLVEVFGAFCSGYIVFCPGADDTASDEDLICSCAGWVVVVANGRRGNGPTPIQRHRILWLRHANGPRGSGHIIDSIPSHECR